MCNTFNHTHLVCVLITLHVFAQQVFCLTSLQIVHINHAHEVSMRRKRLFKNKSELYESIKLNLKNTVNDKQIESILNALVDAEVEAIEKCRLSVVMPLRRLATRRTKRINE